MSTLIIVKHGKPVNSKTVSKGIYKYFTKMKTSKPIHSFSFISSNHKVFRKCILTLQFKNIFFDKNIFKSSLNCNLFFTSSWINIKKLHCLRQYLLFNDTLF